MFIPVLIEAGVRVLLGEGRRPSGVPPLEVFGVIQQVAQQAVQAANLAREANAAGLAIQFPDNLSLAEKLALRGTELGHYQEALRHDPNHDAYQFNRTITQAQIANLQGVIEDGRIDADQVLTVAQQLVGRRQALAHFQEAHRLNATDEVYQGNITRTQGKISRLEQRQTALAQVAEVEALLHDAMTTEQAREAHGLFLTIDTPEGREGIRRATQRIRELRLQQQETLSAQDPIMPGTGGYIDEQKDEQKDEQVNEHIIAAASQEGAIDVVVGGGMPVGNPAGLFHHRNNVAPQPDAVDNPGTFRFKRNFYSTGR